MTGLKKDLNDKTLEELSRKVAEATMARQEVKKAPAVNNSGMALGMRMASEFVSAIIVGSVFGFGFDYLVNTKPLGLFLGLSFGFAAGVVNIVRVSKEISKDVPMGQDLPPDQTIEN